MGASSADRRGVIDEGALRALVPQVLAGLVRRGEDFDAAEDALQEALLEALRVWPDHPAARPARVAGDGRDAAAGRRPPQRGRPPAPRGGDERRASVGSADFRGGRRHALPALLLLSPRPRARLPGGADPPCRRRPHDQGDRRRLLRPGGDDGAADQPRQARSGRHAARRLDQPGDLAVVLLVLYLIYTAGHAGPGGPGARGDPARPSAHPGHRRTGGPRAARAHAPQPRTPPGAIRRAGSHRHARPAGPWPVGHARDRRGRARPAIGAGDGAPRALPDRGRHRRAARRRGQSPRRPTGRRSSPGTTTSSRSPTTRCATIPPPCSAARSRSATPSMRAPGCGRPTGCARCSATATAGTPCAATCTSSTATCPQPPTAFAEAARRATNVAERDHLVRQAARARAAELLSRHTRWEERS